MSGKKSGALVVLALSWVCALQASAQPAYVFSSWQAGAVGDCLVTAHHRTSDCKAAPGVGGHVPPDAFVKTYLENQEIPDAPVGQRVSVVIKLREPVQGVPPDAAQAAVTEIHQRDLQRQYYPRAALAAKQEGKASADCIVRDNGQLDTCWIKDETPAGAGFGGATLNLINLMKLASPLPADRRQSFDMTWSLPEPSDQVLVTCLITPEALTRDCTTDLDEDFPGAAQAVLSALEKQPLHLAGAPAGQKIAIALIRSQIGAPQAAAAASPAAAPYKPARVTQLSGSDVLYYYPAISIRLEEAGATDVQCKVRDDGRLDECWTVNNPANSERLARAHLRLTEIVRMQTPPPDAPAYDQRLYTFRIVWSLK